MHVITVLFETHSEFAEEFRSVVLAQAKNSLAREEGCTRFDVCQDADNPARFFLYEFYKDREAFQPHLESDHYRDFNVKTADWVSLKQPQGWDLLDT
ncbi:MAG: putative quinol monooxygenase [Methyloligellaceae bacterium]